MSRMMTMKQKKRSKPQCNTRHVILIRECDCRVLLITPRCHTRWFAPINWRKMIRWLFAGKATMKNIMQRTGSKSWPGKNCIVQKTLRFSNHVVKAGMKTIGKGSPAAREPIANRTRNTLEITEDNTVKTTGKGSTNTGDDIMPRTKNGSDIDFVTKRKKNRQEYYALESLGPRVWETENESSSQCCTLWNTDGQDLKL